MQSQSPPPSIDQGILDDMPTFSEWRRHLHRHPELSFKEHETSSWIQQRLSEFGIPYEAGLAGTGIVAWLDNDNDNGNGERGEAIGLRADIDALPILEENDFEHRSQSQGVMHACGHDGHTTMLLGAARRLQLKPSFKGRVYFIFQPAEEDGGGGDVMVREGLFKRFPMKAVYGLHNWPGMPLGSFSTCPGPIMAAADTFDLKITGRGGHAAMPQKTIDPIVAGSHAVLALQTLASRSTDPNDSLVLSFTKMQAGNSYNVIPSEMEFCGTVRTLSTELRRRVPDMMRRTLDGICKAFGCKYELDYQTIYPETVNTAEEARISLEAAAAVVGEGAVSIAAPQMTSEDFSFMLNACKGCYILAGGGEDRAGLHHPAYDFNDDLIPYGVQYWVNLASSQLAKSPDHKSASNA